MIVIRFGGVFADDVPLNVRQLAGYLSQADAVQLIDLCLGAPQDLRFDMFDAVSNNPRQWRDTRHAREVLGWQPTGSSKRFESIFSDSPKA